MANVHQSGYDARSGLRIPFIRDTWMEPFPRGLTTNIIPDSFFVLTGDDIGPFLCRDGPFRVISNRHTGNSEACCFFLDAARIGYDERRVLHQAEEVQIAHGLG